MLSSSVECRRSGSQLTLAPPSPRPRRQEEPLPPPPSKASSNAGRRVACSSGRWWLACDDEVGEEEEKERVEIWQCGRRRTREVFEEEEGIMLSIGGGLHLLALPRLLLTNKHQKKSENQEDALPEATPLKAPARCQRGLSVLLRV